MAMAQARVVKTYPSFALNSGVIGDHRDLLAADGVALDGALLGCRVFLIEEFGAGEDFHGDVT